MWKSFILYLAFFVFLNGLSLGQTASPESDKILPTLAGDYDFLGAVALLKANGYTVNVEGPFLYPKIQIHFDEANSTVGTFLDYFKSASQFEYSMNSSRITLSYSGLNTSDKTFPLNRIIPHFDIKHLPYNEAIDELSKQNNISIIAIYPVHHVPTVTLHMNGTSIIEIFNEISKEVQDKGWYSYTKLVKGKWVTLVVF